MSAPADVGNGGLEPASDQLGSLLEQLNAPVVTDTERVVTGPPVRRVSPPAASPAPVRPSVAGDDTDSSDDDTDAGDDTSDDDTSGTSTGADTDGGNVDESAGAVGEGGGTAAGPDGTVSPATPSRPRAVLPRTFGRTRRQEGATLNTSASIPSHLLRELQRRQLEERTVGRQLRIGRYLNDAIRALPSRPSDLASELTVHADELNVERTSRDEGWRPMTTRAVKLDADASATLDKIILAVYDKYDTQLTRNQLIGLALLRALRS
jgi:hypothetical protein